MSHPGWSKESAKSSPQASARLGALSVYGAVTCGAKAGEGKRVGMGGHLPASENRAGGGGGQGTPNWAHMPTTMVDVLG